MEEELIEEYRYHLGNEIKKVRKLRNMSQNDLAEKLGINRSTISKIENGKFSISVDYLVKFSLALDYEFRVIKKISKEVNQN